MTKNRLLEIIGKQRKISDRNYQNYQESGTARYYRAHEKAEEIIDICNQALASADDHQNAGICRSYISDWGTKAVKLLHDNATDDAETVSLLKDIKSMAIVMGLTSDPWK